MHKWIIPNNISITCIYKIEWIFISYWLDMRLLSYLRVLLAVPAVAPSCCCCCLRLAPRPLPVAAGGSPPVTETESQTQIQTSAWFIQHQLKAYTLAAEQPGDRAQSKGHRVWQTWLSIKAICLSPLICAKQVRVRFQCLTGKRGGASTQKHELVLQINQTSPSKSIKSAKINAKRGEVTGAPNISLPLVKHSIFTWKRRSTWNTTHSFKDTHQQWAQISNFNHFCSLEVSFTI